MRKHHPRRTRHSSSSRPGLNKQPRLSLDASSPSLPSGSINQDEIEDEVNSQAGSFTELQDDYQMPPLTDHSDSENDDEEEFEWLEQATKQQSDYSLLSQHLKDAKEI